VKEGFKKLVFVYNGCNREKITVMAFLTAKRDVYVYTCQFFSVFGKITKFIELNSLQGYAMEGSSLRNHLESFTCR